VGVGVGVRRGGDLIREKRLFGFGQKNMYKQIHKTRVSVILFKHCQNSNVFCKKKRKKKKPEYPLWSLRVMINCHTCNYEKPVDDSVSFKHVNEVPA